MSRAFDTLRSGLGKISDGANRLTELALIPIAVIFVAIIFGSVLTRFMFHESMVESVELARLAFVWVMLLASASGVHRRAHVAIVTLRDGFPVRWRSLTEMLVHLLMAVFGAMMCAYGVELATRVWATSFPTLGWSQAWLYIPLAVSGALIALHGLNFAAAAGNGADAMTTTP